jgi:hypothetical protein
MAPVIAIGSSFLVAGSASATVNKTKSVKPTITVCKSVAGTFRFTVNGKSLTLKAQCAAVTAKAGVNHVIEMSAPASYRNLTGITISPKATRVGSSLRNASATVKLSAHGAATVRFVNAKVVTQVITRSSSGSGGSSGSNGTKGGSVGNTTSHAGQGLIEICKSREDSWVPGTGSLWPFTITGAINPGTVWAPYGDECTSPQAVTAGTVTVSEADVFPYELYSATTTPPYAAGTVTPGSWQNGPAGSSPGSASGSVSVTVGNGQDVIVYVTNFTVTSQFKICKTLSNNQGNLAGQTFNFDYSWSSAPTSSAAYANNVGGSFTWAAGTGEADVTAIASPGTICSTGISAPAGASVSVSEGTAVPYVAVTGVAIVPSGFAAAGNGTNGAAAFTLPLDESAVEATFTNDPLGYIEVCKNFWPSPYDANYSAQFSVNGGPSITVAGGTCSAPIQVPAGTATVSETLAGSFYLYKVSTWSASDPMGARLLTGDTVNPASVVVPYGGVGNETVVTFTNAVDPTQFKICTQETSPDANLDPASFQFNWTYSGDPDPSGSVVLTTVALSPANPQGEVCSGLFWGPPAVNPDGSTTNVVITETAATGPDAPPLGTEASSYLYQGNGSATSNIPQVITPSGSAEVTVTPGAGINVVTFTNGRTAS